VTYLPTRRMVLVAGSAAAIAARASAEDTPMRRIVVVAGASGPSWPPWVAFDDELRRLGHADGHNIAIDYIWRAGEQSLPALAEAITAELGRGAEIIVASGQERTLATAAAATRTVPIIMIAFEYDPLARGYIASLARPGGNITGVSLQTTEITAKRLDLFKQAVPDMRRVALLWDRLAADTYEAAQKAAAALGIPAVSVEFRETPYDYERALDEAGVGRGDGLMVLSSVRFARDREKLAELALRRGLPAMSGNAREWLESGGLMSYGVSETGMGRLGARYVDKILKGAKPADLPVEQPTRFELVVNLKAAKTLGLTIPDSILIRADEVIE
jgi:putative tryptophan/tyrosine transport system substrate-binding protein